MCAGRISVSGFVIVSRSNSFRNNSVEFLILDLVLGRSNFENLKVVRRPKLFLYVHFDIESNNKTVIHVRFDENLC